MRMRQLFLLSLIVLLLSACGPTRVRTRPFSPADLTLGSRVVQTARTQLGRPYRHGGTSPARGFDCSGLVWWAFRKNGVNVPRTTSEQASAGHRVSLSRVRPGDILVFKTSPLWGNLHTALYVGNGYFIHSPRSGKRIRMERLPNSYWSPRLKTIRRVIR